MEMSGCPKYSKCSAPICPLDRDWPQRVHRKGESVCAYLLETVKPNAETHFQGVPAREIYGVIQNIAEAMSTRYGPIARALRRAKRSGSRMKQPGRIRDAA